MGQALQTYVFQQHGILGDNVYFFDSLNAIQVLFSKKNRGAQDAWERVTGCEGRDGLK